jgi:putative MATE family efflux protein
MAKMYDMTKGSIFKNLLVVALPVLLTSISQMAYNLTDMFWIGKVDSIGLNESSAISGIGTAGYISWFAFGLILVAKIGTSVKVSHAAGAQQHGLIEQYATNGLTIAFILGSILSLIIFFFKSQIVGIFNIDDPEIVSAATSYLSIVGTFLIIQFVTSGFQAINEGLGKTALNFSVLVVGLLMNIGLDPLFILTFKMGVSGAAIATVISQAVTLSIFIIIYYAKRKTAWSFHFENIKLSVMKDIIRIGSFASLQSLFFTSISIYIARMIFIYGGEVMAAQRIGSQIEQLTWMIAGGFQTALTVFVGQNFGARQTVRIKQGALMLSGMLIPYALIVGLALFLFAEPLIRIFIDDPVTVEFGRQYLRIISVSQVFMMLEGIGTGLFNGVGKSIIPSLVGVIGNTFRIPGAILLSAEIGYIGIWWTLNFSDIFKGMVMLTASLILLANIGKILETKKNRLVKTIG